MLNKKCAQLSSLAISIIAIIYSFAINYVIYKKYLSSSGKTQALFELTTLNYFLDKSIIICLTLISIFVSIVPATKNQSITSILSVIISLITIALMVFPAWKILLN